MNCDPSSPQSLTKEMKIKWRDSWNLSKIQRHSQDANLLPYLQPYQDAITWVSLCSARLRGAIRYQQCIVLLTQKVLAGRSWSALSIQIIPRLMATSKHTFSTNLPKFSVEFSEPNSWTGNLSWKELTDWVFSRRKPPKALDVLEMPEPYLPSPPEPRKGHKL